MIGELWLQNAEQSLSDKLFVCTYTHWSFSDLHCVHILQAHTNIGIRYTTMHDNKTHVPDDCMLRMKTKPLLSTMHHFIRTKLASYSTHCNVFSINCVR